MLYQLRKYRLLMISGFLVFYTTGGLHHPLLECLHFLSHMGDIASGHYHTHGFHSHSTDHTHASLQTLASIADSTTDDSFPVNETLPVQLKKFPQVIPVIGCLGDVDPGNCTANFSYSFEKPIHYPSILTPPPKSYPFFYC